MVQPRMTPIVLHREESVGSAVSLYPKGRTWLSALKPSELHSTPAVHCSKMSTTVSHDIWTEMAARG